MDKYICHNQKGMITLEACYIIPLTLVVTIMLLWLGMYLYDCNVMSQSASIAAICGSRAAEKSNEEIVELVSERVGELMVKRLVAMQSPQVSVVVDYDTIKVTISGQMELPNLFLNTGIRSDPLWEFTTTQQANRLRMSTITRTIHTLSTLSENGISSNAVTTDTQATDGT